MAKERSRKQDEQINLDSFELRLSNSIIDNGGARISVVLCNYPYDEPRLVIKYFSSDQYFPPTDDHQQFEVGKTYNIRIFEKQELVDLRDCLSKALELWPQIIREEKNRINDKSHRP
jgi:hypothetical protein